jgi:hypothetical protein
MPRGLELTGTNEEWLRRSADASTRLGLPSSIAAVLIETGLVEENVRGTLDISDAGLNYLKIRGISTNIQKRRRPHK